jgi:excinuclease ABC subunit B
LQLFDPLTGRIRQKVPRFVVYPKSHYVTPRDKVMMSIETIKLELAERIDYFVKQGKLVEAQRIEQRTNYDLEMMEATGSCNGNTYSQVYDAAGRYLFIGLKADF